MVLKRFEYKDIHLKTITTRNRRDMHCVKKNWIRWAFLFPAISQNQIKPNSTFFPSILRKRMFHQVSHLSLLYFLRLWVSLIGDVERWSWRPCVQVWANYRDSHQGLAAFWLQAQGIQSSWGSTWVNPLPPNITMQWAYLRDPAKLLLIWQI